MIYQPDEPLLGPRMKLADKSIQMDYYGYSPMASELVERIASSPNKYVFGIYGPWGSGKTTMLHLIKSILDADASKNIYKVVWFDAWPYATSGSLVEPLLARIAASFGDKPNIKEKVKCLLKEIAVLSLFFMGSFAKVVGGVGIKDTKEDMEASLELVYGSEPGLWEDPVRKINDEFKKLVEQILGSSSDQRLIFLIDNLDRCLPELAVKLLESLSNLLFVDRCIFFLAVDHHVLASYIKSRYRQAVLSGYEYLEKIILFNIHLPGTIWSKGLSGYIKRLGDKYLSQELSDSLAEFCAGHPKLSNPRRLLRIVNRFLALRDLKIEKEEYTFRKVNPKSKRVFAAISLYHAWTEFFLLLTNLDDEDIKIFGSATDRHDVEKKLKLKSYAAHFVKDPELVKYLLNPWVKDMLSNWAEINQYLYWCGLRLRL